MKFLDTLKDSLYNESYVKVTPFFHKEAAGPLSGESGVLPDYQVMGDSYVAIVFLVCIVMTVIMSAKATNFISFQYRNLIRTPRENSIMMRETSDELNYLAYFIIQSLLLTSLAAYFILDYYNDGGFVISQYALMSVLFGVITLYHVVKEVLMGIVHPVFFSRGKRKLYMGTRMFLEAVVGTLMLPIMLMHVYYFQNVKILIHSAAIVVLCTSLLRFYKVNRIFFPKRTHFLQFFLYLCTLEAVPIALLTGVMMFLANYLQVNN